MNSEARRVPRRDYVILPLLSLITILLIFAVAEITARMLWPAQESDSCAVRDPVNGVRFLPNCTSTLKNAEGIWSTNRYNECGYRSQTPCGPKPPGSARIVVLGSSIAQGMFIPYDETFYVRAAKQLQERCRIKIDVQNLGVPSASPVLVYRRMSEALALKPDIVLFVLTPFDLEQQINAEELESRNSSARHSVESAVEPKVSPFNRLDKAVRQSRAVLIAQHYLFSDKDTFLKLYLVYGDKADFLRTPLSAAWQKRFQDMDLIIGDMTRRTREAGAQFFVVPVPSRAEAALLSARHPRPGIDAADFGRELESIAAKHGAGYVDLMNTFRQIPNSENLFYVVDGHLTPEGEQVVAAQLAQRLAYGGFPTFGPCSDHKGRS